MSLVSPIASILDKVIPDKAERERLAHEIATMAETHSHEISQGQIEINKQEAAHRALFVAGWRPFTGWTCALALFINYITLPILGTIITVFSDNAPYVAPLDMEIMMPVLIGMLGLGGLRSYEKRNRVARER